MTISAFDLFGYCLGSAMLALLLMALGIAVSMPTISRWSKRFFITFFSMLILCVILCFIDTFIYKNPNLVIAEQIVAYFEALFLSMLIPVPTILLLHYCGESDKES